MIKIEAKHEVALPKEHKDLLEKILEEINREEISCKNSSLVSNSPEIISGELISYINICREQPAVKLILPHLVDVIFNKYIAFLVNPIRGDTKMSLVYIEILQAILENKFWNCEEKIDLYLLLMSDALTRGTYFTEEDENISIEICLKFKYKCASTIHYIIQEFGTRYQIISPCVYERIKEVFNNSDERTYAQCYGPFKFLSLQNIFFIADSIEFIKLIKGVIKNPMQIDEFREPCIQVIKTIIKNIYYYYMNNKLRLEVHKEVYDELMEVVYHAYPDLIYQNDQMLDF